MAPNMTPASPPPESRGPLLPVVALVLSLVLLCAPPLLLITAALGLYGFLKGKKDPYWALRRQLTQMTMAVSGAGLVIFVGVAIPAFKKGQLRIKQLECKETLTSLHAAQLRLYEREKRYTTRLDELDFKPQLESVTVYLDSSQPVQGVPALVQAAVGVHGECPACSVTMLCTRQLDNDDLQDAWTISTVERLGDRGEKISGGLAWCEVDDVTQ